MRHVLAVIALMTLSAAAPGDAAAPVVQSAAAPPATAAPDATDPALMAEATALAALVAPDTLLMEKAELMLVQTVTQMFRTDADLITLKEQFPTAETVFTNVVRRVTMDEMRATTPQYRADLAAIFADKMTLPNLQAAHQFWRSESGRAFARRVSDNQSFAATTASILANVDSDGPMVSAGAATSDIKASVASTMADLPADIMRDVMLFARSPAGQQFATLAPARLALEERYAQQPLSPAADARIEAEMGAALEQLMNGDKGRRSKN